MLLAIVQKQSLLTAIHPGHWTAHKCNQGKQAVTVAATSLWHKLVPALWIQTETCRAALHVSTWPGLNASSVNSYVHFIKNKNERITWQTVINYDRFFFHPCPPKWGVIRNTPPIRPISVNYYFTVGKCFELILLSLTLCFAFTCDTYCIPRS